MPAFFASTFTKFCGTSYPGTGPYGPANPKRPEYNTGRKRVNLNGAVNALDPTEVYAPSSESVNAQSTIELFERVLAQNNHKKVIYVVSDNARYYHSKVLQEWLENHPKIVWI